MSLGMPINKDVQKSINSNNPDFYPTPLSLVEKMILKADWRYVSEVLEPSAGKGDLVKGLLYLKNTNKVFSFDGSLCNSRAEVEALKEKRNQINEEVFLKYNGLCSSSRICVDAIECDPVLQSLFRNSFSQNYINSLKSKRKELESGYRFVRPDPKNPGSYTGISVISGKNEVLSAALAKELYSCDQQLLLFSYFSDDFENSDSVRLVYNDFLTFTPVKHYDLILMNPPFSKGAEHLMKALQLLSECGGQIVCLLNAETLKNPYTKVRADLVASLKKLNATVEYIKDAFRSGAERTTPVEIALVYVHIPKTEHKSVIFEKLKQSNSKYTDDSFKNKTSTDLELTDLIPQLVNRYNMEAQAGAALINEYYSVAGVLDFGCDRYTSLLKLVDDQGEPADINKFVRNLRLKYWRLLFENTKFLHSLPEQTQAEYRTQIGTYASYDFSIENLQLVFREVNASLKGSLEAEAVKLFDNLTFVHAHFPGAETNRYMFDTWKTNKAWKIGKKSILPAYRVYSSAFNRFDAYETQKAVGDIERVLNFFDGNMTADINLHDTIKTAFEHGIYKNIQCKYFKLTVYKKGTIHLEYTCPELIDKFNIYICRYKNWLPSDFGAKAYQSMTPEDKKVADSFFSDRAYKNGSAEKVYNNIVSKQDYYLSAPGNMGNTFYITG